MEEGTVVSPVSTTNMVRFPSDNPGRNSEGIALNTSLAVWLYDSDENSKNSMGKIFMRYFC